MRKEDAKGIDRSNLAPFALVLNARSLRGSEHLRRGEVRPRDGDRIFEDGRVGQIVRIECPGQDRLSGV